MSGTAAIKQSHALVWGESGRARAAALLARSRLCAVATFPEYTPHTLGDGPVHAPAALQLMAISDGESHCVLDVQRTPNLASIWPAHKAVAALDGQRLQHALWRTNAGEPARWASFSLLAQLLAAPHPVPTDAASLSHDVGHAQPLPDASSVLGLCQRADAFARVAWAQAEAVRGAQLANVARLEAAAVTPVAALEHHGLPFDAAMLRHVIATERQWLQSPQATDDPARARAVHHLLATAGDTLLATVQADGRIHASVSQIGASSGRMATRAPNIQGLPKQGHRRACVRAPRGYALVVADYGACELRILAHASGDAAYRDAFATGQDVHQTIAARLFGCASASHVTTAQRDAAKAVSFGLVYGMHPKGLAKRLACSLSEAQSHMAAFFRMYPTIRQYLEDTASRDLRRSEIRTLLGRRVRLLPEDAARNARLARNLPIQGSGADMLKLALRHVYQMAPWGSDTHLVHAVHDSLMVLTPTGEAPAVKQQLCAAMQTAASEVAGDVRWQVDASIGSHWQ